MQKFHPKKVSFNNDVGFRHGEGKKKIVKSYHSENNPKIGRKNKDPKQSFQLWKMTRGKKQMEKNIHSWKTAKIMDKDCERL